MKKAMLIENTKTRSYFMLPATSILQAIVEKEPVYRILGTFEKVPSIIVTSLAGNRSLKEIREFLSSEQTGAAEYAGEMEKLLSKLPEEWF